MSVRRKLFCDKKKHNLRQKNETCDNPHGVGRRVQKSCAIVGLF